MGLKQNQALVAQYPVLQFFVYNHLPEELQKVSQPFHSLAWKQAKQRPPGPEVAVALRKLLEAKDAAVRAEFAYNPTTEEDDADV